MWTIHKSQGSVLHGFQLNKVIKNTREKWQLRVLQPPSQLQSDRGKLKCDGTCTETRPLLSKTHVSPFKLAGAASLQSTTGSWGVRISVSNAGFTMFRCSVKGTVYTPHLPVSPSIPLPCITLCHHISTAVYHSRMQLHWCCWRFKPSGMQCVTGQVVPGISEAHSVSLYR